MIESPLLPRICGFLGGEWVGAESGETFEVVDPATGDVLARAPRMGEKEAADAVDAASRSLEPDVPLDERRRWLLDIHALLRENREELARIITLEQGKPLREAAVEVDYCAGFFRFFAGEVRRLPPRARKRPIRGCRSTVYHRPAGVAALITPWNFPLAMMGKKVAPALAAGCAVVEKPSELTPLSAIAFWTLALRAGVPPGRLNLVVGDPARIGEVLAGHPAVRVLSFTGSTEVGKLLAARAAPHVKRLTLELGGNAPFIVFGDARIDAAADALIANKFRAGGQTCVSTNRVYVHQSVAAPFTEAVAERVRRLRVGNGMDPLTDVGPLIDRDAFDKVAEHVRDALARGARRVVGHDPSRPEKTWGAYYPPTVIIGVTPDMLVCREETFGPVVAIALFDDEDRVIAEANGTPCGLAAYFFTRDPARAERVTARLHFGHVGANTGAGPAPDRPFGGMKQSGYGREGGHEGLLEFCETQVVLSA